MQIFNNPDEQAVKRFLVDAQLPVSDLTPGHMQHFFACGKPGGIEGVVGLELFGDTGLVALPCGYQLHAGTWAWTSVGRRG